MNKSGLLWNAPFIAALAAALVMMSCTDPFLPPSDARAALAAGPAVQVSADQTSADVIFTGAAGLDNLPADDFVVISGDASITQVNTSGGTVTVTTGFDANTSSDTDNTIVIGINPDSTVIRGNDTVTIVHDFIGETRTYLTAGFPIAAGTNATTATVTFSGAAGFTTEDLEVTDFTVTDESGTANADIANVIVNNDIVVITVTFPANDSAERVFTVGIASSSTVIKGTTTVTITQEGAQPVTMKIINQITRPRNNDDTTTQDNASFLILEKIDLHTWHWAADENPVRVRSFGSGPFSASNSPLDTGIREGTVLYADIVPANGFTLEVKLRIIRNSPNNTGVMVGMIADVLNLSETNNFKGFVGLIHRSPQLRYIYPIDVAVEDLSGVGLRVGSLSNPNLNAADDPYTYIAEVSGNGISPAHYSGTILHGGNIIIGSAGNIGTFNFSSLITGSDVQRYPGIIIYGAEIDIFEITLELTP